MKDALFADPVVERDGGVPAVVAPPVVPVVLGELSLCCRHPTTVIAPLCPARGVCGELGVVCFGGSCAATSATHPKAIAAIDPAILISASIFFIYARQAECCGANLDLCLCRG